MFISIPPSHYDFILCDIVEHALEPPQTQKSDIPTFAIVCVTLKTIYVKYPVIHHKAGWL